MRLVLATRSNHAFVRDIHCPFIQNHLFTVIIRLESLYGQSRVLLLRSVSASCVEQYISVTFRVIHSVHKCIKFPLTITSASNSADFAGLGSGRVASGGIAEEMRDEMLEEFSQCRKTTAHDQKVGFNDAVVVEVSIE